jgi:predicted HAD superfamily Cof-like phosphohydrolase
LTHFILLSAEETGSKSNNELLRFECESCGEVKLSHQLGKHAYIHHGSDEISVDTTMRRRRKVKDYQDLVREFHEANDAPVGDLPKALPQGRKKLRIGLIKEELKELRVALKADDPVAIYDACLDLLYVIFGLLVETGMDARPGFEEVHRSNMSKLDDFGKPIISRGEELDGYPAGKILKGPNYSPPDLKKVLREQTIRKYLYGAPKNGRTDLKSVSKSLLEQGTQVHNNLESVAQSLVELRPEMPTQ